MSTETARLELAVGSSEVAVAEQRLDGFNRRAETAEDRAGRFRRATTQLRTGVNRAAVGIGTMGTAAAGVGAAFTAHLVNSSSKSAREILALTEVADANAQALQRQAFAASTVGVKAEKLGDIYKDVNDKVGDFIATGGGELQEFFNEIAPQVGVTAEQFKNLSGPDALQLYVDTLEAAGASQKEMTFYLEAIGNDAARLAPLLRNGGERMRELSDRADELGIVLSDLELERLNSTRQRLDEVGKTASKLGQVFAVQLSPYVNEASDRFTEAAEASNGFRKQSAEAIDEVITAASYLVMPIEGAARTFEILGKTAAGVGLELEKMFWDVADTVVNGPNKAVNDFIGLINNIPGVEAEQVGFSELGNTIKRNLETTKQAIIEAEQDLQDTLMRPMLHKEMEGFMDDVQDRIDNFDPGNNGSDNTGDDEDTGPRINLEAHHKLNEMLVEAEREKQEKITDEKEKGQQARSRITQIEMQSELQAYSSILGQLSRLQRSENRKMFEAGKVAASSRALISGYERAEDAAKWGMKWGGPGLATAFAGASWLSTMQRISQIQNASFSGGSSGGGGGGGGMGSSGGGGGPQQAPTAPPPAGLGGGQSGGGNNVQITFNGNVNGLDEQDIVDRMKKTLGEDIENRDFVLFSSRSRQAREIQR